MFSIISLRFFLFKGYLVLASESGAEILAQNSRLQNEMGARNELLTSAQLKVKFPWLNTEGIALGYIFLIYICIFNKN